MSDQMNYEPQPSEQQSVRRPMTEKERLDALKKRDLAFKRKQQMLKEASPEERARMQNNAQKNHAAKVKAKEAAEQPTGIAAKWENFWYHYKPFIIIGALLVGLMTWVIYVWITNVKYDINMMLLTSIDYEMEACDVLEEDLTKYLDKDLNSDGKKNIDIEIFNFASDAEVETTDSVDAHQAKQGKFMNSFGYGDNLVYLMNLEMYEYTTSELVGVKYLDLSQYTNSDLVDGDKYYIEKDSDFAGLESQEELVLVVRDLSNLKDGEKESMIKRHANELEFVKKIIAEP